MTRELLETPPVGYWARVGRLAQTLVLCPGTGTGWVPARPALAELGSVPAWLLQGPWGPVPGFRSSALRPPRPPWGVICLVAASCPWASSVLSPGLALGVSYSGRGWRGIS